jgi:hypothetical protein
MLQAMNTGHDGSMSTVHANTTRDALSRIENMVEMSGMGLPARAIRTQIVAAINIIVQLERQHDGVRRVSQVTEIAGMETDIILMNDIFKFVLVSEAAGGAITGRYEVSRIRPIFAEKLRYFGLERAWASALDEAMGIGAGPAPLSSAFSLAMAIWVSSAARRRRAISKYFSVRKIVSALSTPCASITSKTDCIRT